MRRRDAGPPQRSSRRPEGRTSRAVAGKPHRDRVLGCWLLPLPTIDPMVVARSGAALRGVRPRLPLLPLRRHQDAAVRRRRRRRRRRRSWLAAQVPPLRRLAARRGSSRATGPTRARRAKSWFTVDFVGEGGGQTVHTRVSGGDPGYDETAKMLAESALCLAFDDNPPTAGPGHHGAGDGRRADRPAACRRA